jgi:hypothetical protein
LQILFRFKRNKYGAEGVKQQRLWKIPESQAAKIYIIVEEVDQSAT